MSTRPVRLVPSGMTLAAMLLAAAAGTPFVGETEADRERIVRDNLALTAAEAERFWPLYRAYREEMQAIDLRAAELAGHWPQVFDGSVPISRYKIDAWLDQMLSVRDESVRVRERYLKRFRKDLPSRKILQLMLLEARLDAIVEQRRSEGIPLGAAMAGGGP